MPSEQPPTRVETCPTCGHPRKVVTSDEGTTYFVPPSEQPREGEARVDLGDIELLRLVHGYLEPISRMPSTQEREMKAAVSRILAALESAQPQPREPKRECVHEWCPHRCSAYCRDPKGAQPQPRGEGDDLAARLEEKARAESDEFGNYHDRYAEGRADAFDEAASALRASTHPEQSARVERIIGICRNPAAPFYWDADRIGEPCPGCACWSDDINPPNHQHEFYVQVEPASTPEPEDSDA